MQLPSSAPTPSSATRWNERANVEGGGRAGKGQGSKVRAIFHPWRDGYRVHLAITRQVKQYRATWAPPPPPPSLKINRVSPAKKILHYRASIDSPGTAKPMIIPDAIISVQHYRRKREAPFCACETARLNFTNIIAKGVSLLKTLRYIDIYFVFLWLHIFTFLYIFIYIFNYISSFIKIHINYFFYLTRISFIINFLLLLHFVYI